MLVDANIFLELFLEQERMDRCKEFLNKTVNGQIKAIISDFSVDSIIITMERNKLFKDKMKSFLQKLLDSEGIKIYSVSIKDRMRALYFMEIYGLDYEDAIILQSALSSNCKEIVSFDKHFDKVKEIKRVEP